LLKFNITSEDVRQNKTNVEKNKSSISYHKYIFIIRRPITNRSKQSVCCPVLLSALYCLSLILLTAFGFVHRDNISVSVKANSNIYLTNFHREFRKTVASLVQIN